MLYPDPLPIPASIDQHYDVPPEDYWHDEYFHVDEGYMRQQIERFGRLWKGSKAGDPPAALDIGAGVGHAMLAFARAGMDVYGLEPSAAFRARALDRMGIDPQKLRQTTVEDANYPPCSFDFINFAAVVEHLYDPSSVLRTSLRWLRPGGLMYVEVPSSRYLLSSLVRVLYRLMGSEYVINLCPMHVPYHLYEFSVDSFHKNGATSGYRVAFYEYYACPPKLPAGLDRLAGRIMDATKTGMQLAVWLEKTQVREQSSQESKSGVGQVVRETSPPTVRD